MILKKSAANPADRVLSPDERPFLIAEFGLNHNRDLSLAMQMADAAAASGVDAVKLQSYTTRFFINRQFDNVHALFDIFAGLELDAEFHRRLRDYVVSKGMAFFSTPLTEDWVGTLDALEVPAFKIASGDVNNFGLISAAAKTGKPLLVSTGAASENEIRHAIKQLEDLRASYCLLHCVSLYPTPLARANIGRMAKIRQLLPDPTGIPLGFSDHTEDTDAAFAAIAAGAVVIEKHFTLDKSLPGPDQKMSSDPAQIRELRRRIDLAWAIRGNALNADCHAEETAGDYYGKRALYEFEGKTRAMRPRHPDYPLP
ncbi:MAG: N-acetylneuraminate synthase family protein [Spirochaetota bacterium]